MAYSGPGDVVSGAQAWYGLRAYTAAIAAAATQKLVNVRRDSDNATADILVATNGGLGVTANATAGSNGVSPTTWAAGAGLWIATLYDQTGNGQNLTQATAANQPQLVLSATGSLPGMLFTAAGANSPILVGTILNTLFVAPVTYSGVAEVTGGFGTQADIAFWGGAAQLGVANSGANTWFLYTGSVLSATASDSVLHTVQAIFNTTSSVINIDGSDTTGSGGSSTPSSSTFSIGSTGVGSQPFTGYIWEIGVWILGFSSGQRTSMNTNQTSYWLATILPRVKRNRRFVIPQVLRR